MDPLTILTGTITLGEALINSTSALIQFINKIKNATNDLIYLNNDISDVQGFLRDIFDHAREENTCLANLLAGGVKLGISFDKAPADVLGLMKRTGINIAELKEVVKKATKVTGPGKVEVKMKAWLKENSRLRQLRRDLQDIKSCFSFHFASKSR
ncbi:hypothetical protein ABW20_dc0107388 [Dactylellina cionopaga]|nr:hypothetical protein ABW20_dc0107388 [Dactylellina cionopaga]